MNTFEYNKLKSMQKAIHESEKKEDNLSKYSNIKKLDSLAK